MSTVELQKTLVNNIFFINDITFLTELKKMIDDKMSMEIYRLSDYQKARVEQAQLEWKNGQVVDNEDFLNEVDKWLDTL